jgi:hypothetical protein
MGLRFAVETTILVEGEERLKKHSVETIPVRTAIAAAARVAC